MTNLLNTTICAEYDTILTEELDGLFVQPVGLSVDQSVDLRRKLADNQLRMRVLKGSLARRILEAHGFEDVAFIFDGPAAVIVSSDADADAVAMTAAKLVTSWRKEAGTPLPEIKAGAMEGKLLDGDQARQLDKMPGKEELRSIIVGQIVGPARSISGQLIGPGAAIAGAVETHRKNQETN